MSRTTSRAPLAVNIDETCRILGIGRTKVHAELNAGRLTAVKVGAKTLLPTQQFPGWLKSLPRRKAKTADAQRPEDSAPRPHAA